MSLSDSHKGSGSTVSASTYLAYKRDTNAFVTWLGSMAQARGWKPLKIKTQTSSATAPQHVPPISQNPAATNSNKGTRLKGRERKEAKAKASAAAAAEAAIIKQAGKTTPPSGSTVTATTRYTISTVELLKQMELVGQATEQPVTMPAAINAALQRAIRAREKFSAWYQKTECGTQSSMESHTYFVDLLRKALALFRGSAQHVHLPPVLDTSSDEKADVFIANMFEALELEDVLTDDSEGDGASSDAVPSPLHEQPPGARLASKIEYQLEEDDADVDFAIFALFEDIHRIRSETKGIFKRLAEGNITLMHATVAIAAALELVKQADYEVQDLFCAVEHENSISACKKGTYVAYVKKIYSSKALGRDNLERYSSETLGDAMNSGVEVGPFDEFVLLPLGYSLDKIVWVADKPWKDLSKIQYLPVPMPGMKILIADDAGNTHRDTTPRARKGEADDHFIHQLYRDMLWIEGLKEGRFDEVLQRALPDVGKEIMTDSMLPYFDVLHNALRPVWAERKIGMQSVFAAQTLIDMHDICGPYLSGRQAMQEAHRYAQQLDFVSKAERPAGGGLSIRDVEDLRAPGPRELTIRLYNTVKNRINAEPDWLHFKSTDMVFIKQFQENWLKSAQTDGDERVPAGWAPRPGDSSYLDDPWAVDIMGIWPNQSPTFLQDTNLLYGGTALLDLASLYEQATVAIANENMSILCMAHIYNAARQLGLLDIQWVELDQVIKRQAGALFANDIPTTPRAIHDRCKYRLGFGKSSKGWFKTLTALVKADTYAPWMMKPSQASVLIKQALDTQVPLPRLLYWLEHETSLSNETRKAQVTPRVPDGGAAVAAPSTNSSPRQLTLRQTLRQIETHLDTLLPDIDYISLTRQCQQHLNKLRRRLVSRLNVEYDNFGSATAEYANLARIEMTYMMLHENMLQAEDFEEAQRKGRRKDKAGVGAPSGGGDEAVKPVGPQLEYAARFLGKVLSKNSKDLRLDT